MEVVDAEAVEIAQDDAPPTASTALVVTEPMQLMSIALQRGAGVEVMNSLLMVQERWDARVERVEAREARKAFDSAIADARKEIKPVTKNRRVHFKSKKEDTKATDYRHEDLAEVARTIDPVIGQYGLSYRFKPRVVINEPITVVCIVSHRLGYSEETTISVPRDESGNKNSIQAIGSAITYAQRILLKCAFGLAASNDDDGVGAENDAVGSDELEVLSLMVLETKSNLAMFCKLMGVEALPDIPRSDIGTAVSKLKEKAAKTGVSFKPETQAKIDQMLAKLPGDSK